MIDERIHNGDIAIFTIKPDCLRYHPYKRPKVGNGMKKHGFLMMVILILSLYIMGCSTTPSPPPPRHSFAEDGIETASIFFKDWGNTVRFISFEGARAAGVGRA
jgi:hypothetical protein